MQLWAVKVSFVYSGKSIGYKVIYPLTFIGKIIRRLQATKTWPSFWKSADWWKYKLANTVRFWYFDIINLFMILLFTPCKQKIVDFCTYSTITVWISIRNMTDKFWSYSDSQKHESSCFLSNRFWYISGTFWAAKNLYTLICITF